MLELKNIRKLYTTGDTTLAALDGVSLCFRENEFVSILGPSGCGKTTLLNIVGGLDRYTDGNLIINGKSTKFFRDRDWDTYRNHSIGFVFQSYNLIPHQTVLANVELALTLSGVSKSERRARATEALKKVGLGDQLHKKPNQMSGGQMQRVAIARALVNNPDILLADEPTGALDTQTSVQIMDLLQEVAKDRLVIMVTHNPELAEQYSTRIVRLSDGKVVDDTDPITEEEYQALTQKDEQALIEAKKDKMLQKSQSKKKSMSFGTAVSLSFKNLLTKKGRTILTSFAGSIGIIGIALILALSNGINLFIYQVQEDTLSTYPLTIQKTTRDSSAMMDAMMNTELEKDKERDPNLIYVDDSLDKMVSAMTSTTTNDLVSFKKHLDENEEEINKYVSDIQYTYDLNLVTYNAFKTEDGKIDFRELGVKEIFKNMKDLQSLGDMVDTAGLFNSMSEMIDNQDLLNQQYNVIAGTWPKEYNEIVLVVGKDKSLSKMTLYMLGLLDPDTIDFNLSEKYESKELEKDSYTFKELMDMELYLVNTPNFFEETTKPYPTNSDYFIWEDVRESGKYDPAKFIPENGIKLKVSGIICPREDSTASSISSPLGYTKALTDKIIADTESHPLIVQQKKTPEINATNGRPHDLEEKEYTIDNVDELFATFDANTMSKISSMLGGKLAEQFSALPNEAKDEDDNVTNPKFESFIMYSTMLSNEQKITLVTNLFDSATEIAPQQIPMVFGMLSQGGTLVVDSKEDLLFCLPSIAQDQAQFGMLVGFLANICKNDAETIEKFYEDMLVMLPTLSLSKDVCVNYLKQIAAAENATTEADKEAEDISMTVAEIITLLKTLAPESDATLKSTLKKIGAAEAADPASINFYAKDFESKGKIEEFIKEYNTPADPEHPTEEEKAKKITYTDLVGTLMSSVTVIIDVISYVLIAFVSISLVVSSIMIGIITNISVLERTKEIGILRAIGASKKDISRVFNAETFIVGLAAGILGIVITLLLCIPANAIIYALTGFANVRAVLPPVAAIILILISMALTMIAGLIPAKSASKKDPVVALRSE